MKHHLWMLLACLAPLLLIFALPILGVQTNGLFVLLLLACFGMHLLMMRGHGHGTGKRDAENGDHRD